MTQRSAPREPDAASLAVFVDSLFRYADDGTYVSLRAFDQMDRGKRPVDIRSVHINGAGLKPVIDAAVIAARKAANTRDAAVFAPPIATFSSATRAREIDLANGIAISVEVDDVDPRTARARLEAHLGPATVVVASGGFWIEPGTGEAIPKLHAHWRLSEPTRDAQDHARLKHARHLACLFVGADPTAKTSVHPLRWPGSWHLKAAPTLATIAAVNEAAEVHLGDAIEKLEMAIESIGVQQARSSEGGPRASGAPEADTARIESALTAIPNLDGTHWDEWIRIGLLIFRATGGSDAGLDAWIAWSTKSAKFVAGAGEERWAHFVTSPPTRGGAGTLFMLAKANGWNRPDGAAAQPEQPTAATQSETVADIVAEFNARYMVVNEAGKAVVYAPAFDNVLKRHRFDRIGFEDFRRLYLNRTVIVGRDDKDRPVRKSVADVWLRNAERRQFIGGVAFTPRASNSLPDVLNLWRGLAIEPKAGKWSLMRSHMLTIICNGNCDHFDYLVRWLARLFQHPDRQGEVAVVLKGGEGTGKGTLARAVLRILGQHGLAISNSKHLIGNFNAHLRDAVFLFADEAFFAGDRQHVGVLKSLITEPYLTVEAKFQNAVQSPNFLHVMMASNEDWVVPASLEARRFFVLDVAEAAQGQHGYFAELWAQMEAGGYAAMLHDLMTLDLSDFNVRAVPQTEGLGQQRKLSLPTAERWWLDCLHRGYVLRSRHGLDAHFGRWNDELATDVLFASYETFVDRARERHPLSRETFGRFMRRMGCRPVRLTDAVVGEHMTDVETPYGGTSRKGALVRQPRPRGYDLSTIERARRAFCVTTKLSVDWETDQEDDA